MKVDWLLLIKALGWRLVPEYETVSLQSGLVETVPDYYINDNTGEVLRTKEEVRVWILKLKKEEIEMLRHV